MSRDIIDDVRRCAPDVALASRASRDRQRGKLEDAMAAAPTVEPSLRRETREHPAALPRRSLVRRLRPYLIGATAALVAASIAIPLSQGSPGAAAAAAVMRDGGLTVHVRMPSSLRLTSASTSSCARAESGVSWVSPDLSGSGGQTTTGASSPTTPPYAASISAAANAQGECVVMALAQPYTPTAANPDPESGSFESQAPISVGPYEARAGTWTSYVKPSDSPVQNAALYVQIPLASGQAQDLVVSGDAMSVGALVALVANGISVSGN